LIKGAIMTSQITDTIETTIQVEKVIPAEDRMGIAQWEVHVKWEWSSANAKWPDRVWIYQDTAPTLTPGTYRAEVRRGAVKNNKDGNPHDGTRDWMWKWDIIRWLDLPAVAAPSAATAPSPAPSPAPQPAAPPTTTAVPIGMDEKDKRITWLALSHDASQLVAAALGSQIGINVNERVEVKDAEEYLVNFRESISPVLAETVQNLTYDLYTQMMLQIEGD